MIFEIYCVKTESEHTMIKKKSQKAHFEHKIYKIEKN